MHENAQYISFLLPLLFFNFSLKKKKALGLSLLLARVMFVEQL